MVRLYEPSVEQARRIVEARLTRMKLREDQVRADRGDREQLQLVQAEKTAELRALRLARTAAENCAPAREAARNGDLSRAAATLPGTARIRDRPINARGALDTRVLLGTPRDQLGGQP